MSVSIPEVLVDLAPVSYRFFIKVPMSDTAISEEIMTEVARQSGKAVQLVTNELGETVACTTTNLAIANGETTAVDTVVEFASQQVVVTEELAAKTAVAGGESVAVGSTVTEIGATTTTTAVVGTTVAQAGLCVITAIGGYELGKNIGNYLAEKYPDFWVDTCGKALYEAGCTISSGVLTFMKPNGETFVPKKTVNVIKAQLAKVGAIQSDDTTSIDNTKTYGDWWVKNQIARNDADVFPYYVKTTFTLKNPQTWNPNCMSSFGAYDAYSMVPVNFFYIDGLYCSKRAVLLCAYVPFLNGNSVDENNLKIRDVNRIYSWIYRDKNNTKQGISILPICIMPYQAESSGRIGGELTITDMIIGFNTQVRVLKYVFTDNNPLHDFNILRNYDCYSDLFRYILEQSGATVLDPAKCPDPIRLPKPKIVPNGDPDGEDEAYPVPVPQVKPVAKPVYDPVLDPITTGTTVKTPNPFPNLPPWFHVPDMPEPVPKTPEKPKIPIVPNMTASALSRVFNPTQAELDALGQYLWSSTNLEDFHKLFQNPTDGVISLHAIYGTPTIGSEEEIKLGFLRTGVNAPVVTSQFVVIDCGRIAIGERYNNATDYSPYVTVQIYLPFIGIQSLNPFDIIGSAITCTYKIDVYTGACIAQLNVERDGLDGVIYEFAGNCSYQIPLTSGNYLNVVANVLGGFIGGAMMGNAPGAVLGAGHAALHSNVEIARSGNLTANAGILGNRIPYFIITRSIPHDAFNYPKFYGYPSNKTVALNDCSGYTRVKDIILHTSATQEERDEILKLLTSGVYI